MREIFRSRLFKVLNYLHESDLIPVYSVTDVETLRTMLKLTVEHPKFSQMSLLIKETLKEQYATSVKDLCW